MHACAHYTVITCPSLLPDNSHTSIIYLHDNTTPPFPYGTRANYTIDCPEGMERDGEDDVRTCIRNGSSAVGIWNGTAPTCTGTYIGQPTPQLYSQKDRSRVIMLVHSNGLKVNVVRGERYTE